MDMQVSSHPFVGSIQEMKTKPAGQSFGPLLKAIMTDQFHRVFFGAEGSFWEFENNVKGFETDITDVKLGDIIRRNTKASVPNKVFTIAQ
jgi:hypothetical protein